MQVKTRIGTGIGYLDRILGGLSIGDNVVWHDDAGSLASVFCLNFIKASAAQGRPMIYVSFDRSPRNLLDKLGDLAQNHLLTILDCFTFGKGAGSDVFLKFYEDSQYSAGCRIVRMEDPKDIHSFTKAFYDLHTTMKGDVRFVFESITGMQELWGGEDKMASFYAHSCPRLYELNTIAYWILEKGAHSARLKAQINQIAQVVIDLSVKRGSTYLSIIKAEKRELETINRPFSYWSKGLSVAFEDEGKGSPRGDLGVRLKELRIKRGFSQTELARLVGVTPSTISQVEGNLIYPSLPALLKMAEILAVEVSSFFQEIGAKKNRLIFPAKDAFEIKFNNIPDKAATGRLLIPVDLETRAEPYLIEIAPNTTLQSHFFMHKGDEIGYLISGNLKIIMGNASYSANQGDLIYLSAEMPSAWINEGSATARLLWIKLR
ncbi:MAG: XRE family transcriptional regulator [Deltaproteobacteria bacterium CG23_combo_of_CG06-09_8_20_14_all_51_20]|nr:MAG: XRE family transcriptional regulator [Deltaproteobacteria bacterium CG23_combo_of_CG06-09_8_20_14_all_51_20]